MVPQRISGLLPILVNPQSLHRQPCRYLTFQQSSKSTSWQSLGMERHLQHSPWQHPSLSPQLLGTLLVLGKSFYSHSMLQINWCVWHLLWKSSPWGDFEIFRRVVKSSCKLWEGAQTLSLLVPQELHLVNQPGAVLGLLCVTCQLALFWAHHNENQECLFNYTMKMAWCKNCAPLCTRLGLHKISSYLLCTVVERTNWMGS